MGTIKSIILKLVELGLWKSFVIFVIILFFIGAYFLDNKIDNFVQTKIFKKKKK